MSHTILPCFVAVGASGSEGLHDIIELLCALPKPFPAVLMVVLHRPSNSVSHLQEILARQCNMPVTIASEAEGLVPGICYIGEPDKHLTLMAKAKAQLVPGPGHMYRNRTVDALFNSLAVHAGPKAIGIVLSGSLDDGSRGLAAIHAASGFTMVLDPADKPRGMQQNAIDYDGPINFVGVAGQIARVVGQVVMDRNRP